MIMRKIGNWKLEIGNSREAGVTLLLAVLIMSGLVLIATTVSFLATEQIRASRAQLVSEPAFLAAKTGGEEGLWVVKRGSLSGLPDCGIGATSSNFSSSNTFLNYCKSFTGDTFSVTPGTPTVILLYDPNDPNGDVDLLAYPYSTLTVTNTGSWAVTVKVSRIDGTPMGSDFQVNPGNSSPPVSLGPSVPAGTEGRMQITLTAPGNTTADVTTDRGLPTNMNIASTACSTKTAVVNNCSSANAELYTRKIEVELGN